MKLLPVWICVGLLAIGNLQLMGIHQSVKRAEPLTVAEIQWILQSGASYDSFADRLPLVQVHGTVDVDAGFDFGIMDVKVVNAVDVEVQNTVKAEIDQLGPVRVEVER